MTSRRASWILLFVVVLVSTAFVEVALRTTMPRRRLLDPAEDTYWLIALLAHKSGGDQMDVDHHPQLGWRMLPNMNRGDVQTNAHRMRGVQDYTVERRPGVKRVIVLGDSFSYGLGVATADTYPAILEASREDLEVLNCGANGWGTDQSVLDYELHRKPFDPDVVVVGIFEDDFNRVGVRAREYLKPRYVVENDELVLTNVPIVHPDAFDPQSLEIPGGLRLFDGARYVYQTIRWKTSGKRQLDGPFEEKSEILRLLLRDLKKSATSDRPRPLVVLTWPTMWFEGAWDSARIRRRVMDIAAGLQIPAYDITPQLVARQKKDGVPVYNPVSSHWTRAGHEVAAAQLTAHFEKTGF